MKQNVWVMFPFFLFYFCSHRFRFRGACSIRTLELSPTIILFFGMPQFISPFCLHVCVFVFLLFYFLRTQLRLLFIFIFIYLFIYYLLQHAYVCFICLFTYLFCFGKNSCHHSTYKEEVSRKGLKSPNDILNV